MWDAGIRVQDAGCRDGWKVPDGAATEVYSGVASRGQKSCRSLCPRPVASARGPAGARDLGSLRYALTVISPRWLFSPTLTLSPLAPGREGRRAPLCPSPDLARRRTDRQTGGRSSPGARTRRTRRWDPAGGGGLGAGRVEEGEETDPPSRCDTRVTESPAGPTRHQIRSVFRGSDSNLSSSHLAPMQGPGTQQALNKCLNE